MLKFIKHHMATIEGIEIFPIISFIICFSFFIGLFWWVFGYSKKDITDMSNMPLEDESNDEDKLKKEFIHFRT